MKSLVTATSLACALLACPSYAQHASQEAKSNDALSLFAIANAQQSIYQGGSTQTRVFPFIQFQWGPVYLEGVSLGTSLYQTESQSFDIGVSLDIFGDTERGDSRVLQDMQTLDNALNAHIEWSLEKDWGEVSVRAAKDISGTHDGTALSVNYAYPVVYKRWRIRPQVGVHYFSDEISQYYYGVTPEEVRENRAAYTPDSGVNMSLDVTAIYPFNRHHSLMLMLESTVYSSQITDSPIVEKSNALSLGLGYLYRF